VNIVLVLVNSVLNIMSSRVVMFMVFSVCMRFLL